MTFSDLLVSITLAGFESANYSLPDGHDYFIDIAAVQHAAYPVREDWRRDLDQQVSALKRNMVRDDLELANIALSTLEAGEGYMIQVQVRKQTQEMLEALSGESDVVEDIAEVVVEAVIDDAPVVPEPPRPRMTAIPVPPRNTGRRNG